LASEGSMISQPKSTQAWLYRPLLRYLDRRRLVLGDQQNALGAWLSSLPVIRRGKYSACPLPDRRDMREEYSITSWRPETVILARLLLRPAPDAIRKHLCDYEEVYDERDGDESRRAWTQPLGPYVEQGRIKLARSRTPIFHVTFYIERERAVHGVGLRCLSQTDTQFWYKTMKMLPKSSAAWARC
jgi:hypothetical protein